MLVFDWDTLHGLGTGLFCVDWDRNNRLERQMWIDLSWKVPTGQDGSRIGWTLFATCIAFYLCVCVLCLRFLLPLNHPWLGITIYSFVIFLPFGALLPIVSADFVRAAVLLAFFSPFITAAHRSFSLRLQTAMPC
jgi:hypothetical protein